MVKLLITIVIIFIVFDDSSNYNEKYNVNENKYIIVKGGHLIGNYIAEFNNVKLNIIINFIIIRNINCFIIVNNCVDCYEIKYNVGLVYLCKTGPPYRKPPVLQ